MSASGSAGVTEDVDFRGGILDVALWLLRCGCVRCACVADRSEMATAMAMAIAVADSNKCV